MTHTPSISRTTITAPDPTPDVLVELFYVDEDGCRPCAQAISEAHVAAQLLRDELAARSRSLAVRAVPLHEPGHAQALGVDMPVSVHVDGIDISPATAEDQLAACGPERGTPTSCRSYEWDGRRFDAPPAGLIVEAVHRHLDSLAIPVPGPDEGPLSGIEELRETVRGAVLVPGDAGWEQSKSIYNLAFEQHPAIVVVPADPDDVVTVVRYAAARGVQVVPQRSGHNAKPLGSLAGTVLLRTDAMTDVHIDPERRLAVVGAGAKWGDVVPIASGHGLAALHGSTPDISIVGYSLGGGVGWYAREHGLAANSVTAIEVVTPDGNRRWVDHEDEPDLFWALRGGGGSFGVVTALEFRLYPIPEVYAGALFFPWERSAEVLKAWAHWTLTAPESVTSVGRIIQFPPVEELPEPLRGGSFVVIEAVFTNDETTSAALLEELRRLGPLLDTFANLPPAGIAELHMDPPRPLPYAADHLVLGQVNDQAIDDLVAAVGPGSGSELISVELRHLGGALSRPGSGHGALDRMAGEYLLFGVGATPTDSEAEEVNRRLAAMTAPLVHLATGRYFNFSEHRVDPAVHFTPETYERLQRVRAQVDPGNVIRANHSIALLDTVPDGEWDRSGQGSPR